MAKPAAKRIAASTLERYAGALLEAGGFAPDHAVQTAEMLVWANLRGVESHGVLRIPRYVEMVALGLINPTASVRQVAGRGAVCVLDADRAPGAVAMNAASDRAIAQARDHGVGWCVVKRITHAGAIGVYAEKIAAAGFAAMVMTASKPLMIYHGARSEGVSTNPLAIAVPTADPARPMIFDMSTAAVAAGKITAAKDAGRAIPLGWAVDAEGRETTDPAEVKAVLPMAGPKGTGLSLMIEILASVLVGNPLITLALRDGIEPGGNGIVVALDPSAFGAADQFPTGVSDLAAAIKALEPATGASVLLPGERGDGERLRRLADGIPVADGTASRLAALAAKLGVQVPDQLA
ncbi:MAG: Ldh family oxidoreductase [Phreatobacter sp.]|uniref:Ldh family oxidoreductase n=1 Tax=Phreatobacter sp. TaxID=1966341 RepID=UPI002736E7FE|nr:Ldh family oxidoreductase [Phreatobacter sp.]MDP2800347.1 Ldh family oxidoreductase [Phreatobacter sp.]